VQADPIGSQTYPVAPVHSQAVTTHVAKSVNDPSLNRVASALTPQVPATSPNEPVKAPAIGAEQSSSAASSMMPPQESSSKSSAANTGTGLSKDPVITDTVVEDMGKRPRYKTAIIRAVDKVTAESVLFEAQIGRPVRYKGLVYRVMACETTTPKEARADVMAYMQVNEYRAQHIVAGADRLVFKGWTLASSPGLNPMQSPSYDAWVVSCKDPL